MSRTIRILYRGLQGRVRANFNWGIDPPITKQSVIVMSAAEAKINFGPVFGTLEDITDFHLGDADVYVTNVSPHQGGVEFIIHINWGAPLDVLVDLTVLGPREQFFAHP